MNDTMLHQKPGEELSVMVRGVGYWIDREERI